LSGVKCREQIQQKVGPMNKGDRRLPKEEKQPGRTMAASRGVSSKWFDNLDARRRKRLRIRKKIFNV